MCQELATAIHACALKHPWQILELWAWLNWVFVTFSLISYHEEGIAQLMNLSVLSICSPHRKSIIFGLIILFSAFIVSLQQCYFLIECIEPQCSNPKYFSILFPHKGLWLEEWLSLSSYSTISNTHLEYNNTQTPLFKTLETHRNSSVGIPEHSQKLPFTFFMLFLNLWHHI